MMKFGLIAIALAVASCSKKDDAVAGTSIDVAAVNALVPASLADQLVFEQRTVTEKKRTHPTSFTLAAPKGWSQQYDSSWRGSPDKKSDFRFGTDCQGTCARRTGPR